MSFAQVMTDQLNEFCKTLFCLLNRQNTVIVRSLTHTAQANCTTLPLVPWAWFMASEDRFADYNGKTVSMALSRTDLVQSTFRSFEVKSNSVCP